MRIVSHEIKGNQKTVFHNFNVSEENNEIIISPGTYYENDAITIEIPQETRINKPELSEWSYHGIWLTRNGVKLYSSAENIANPEQPIDRLAWIEIYSPVPAERDIELHVINFVEIEA
jgi:hypothetical protein